MAPCSNLIEMVAVGSGKFVARGIAEFTVVGAQAEVPVTNRALNGVRTSLWRVVDSAILKYTIQPARIACNLFFIGRHTQRLAECIAFLVDRGRFRLFRACEVSGVDLTYCKTAFNTTINFNDDMMAGRAKEGPSVNLSVFDGQ